jgi:hypothetical protein
MTEVSAINNIFFNTIYKEELVRQDKRTISHKALVYAEGADPGAGESPTNRRSAYTRVTRELRLLK